MRTPAPNGGGRGRRGSSLRRPLARRRRAHRPQNPRRRGHGAMSTQAATAGASREGALELARRWVGRYATLIGFAIMIAFFWIDNPDVFGTWENARSILELAAPILILAAGLTVVLSNGEFDLAFPGLIGLAAIVSVKLMSDGGHTATIAVLGGLGVGLAGGL